MNDWTSSKAIPVTILNGDHVLWVALLLTCCARFAAAQPIAQPPLTPKAESFLLGPPNSDGPVVVRASFQLLSISRINDEAETFQFSGVLTLVWKDVRQAFDPVKEGVSEKVFSGAYQFNEISPGWYPQVTLVNAGGQYDSRAVTLRVKSDGTSTLSETLEAVAKVNLNMRRFPFDHQRMEAVFRLFGFDANEVVLETEPKSASAEGWLTKVPQWTLEGVEASTRTMNAPSPSRNGVASAFVVSVDVKRQSLFMLRLVVIPLCLIVMLSWSVFWMDRSSLGDRMSVSFVGILTAVAYQITLGGTLPHISYLTLMNGFLNISFLVMSATVVINLVVGAADRRGRQRGDRIDRCCRWIFPFTYFGFNALALAVTLLFF
jgi:hypothetical protein